MDENFICIKEKFYSKAQLFLRRAARVRGNCRVSVATTCHSGNWWPLQFSRGDCLSLWTHSEPGSMEAQESWLGMSWFLSFCSVGILVHTVMCCGGCSPVYGRMCSSTPSLSSLGNHTVPPQAVKTRMSPYITILPLGSKVILDWETLLYKTEWEEFKNFGGKFWMREVKKEIWDGVGGAF